MIIAATCALYFAYKYYDARLCVKRLKDQSLHISSEAVRNFSQSKNSSDDVLSH